MSETTRRQFLEVAGLAAAATVLAPTALVAAQEAPAPAAPTRSPLPVGPGAPFGAYQSEIYIAGMGTGSVPPFTTDLSALEAAAAKVLSPQAVRHLLEEAGGDGAARANAQALASWRIVPRMFIDRAARDLSTTVLGVAMPAPVILGPVGDQVLAHSGGEGATAQGAAAVGLTSVVSSRSSTPVEGVVAAAPSGSRWFGIDWPAGSGPDTALLNRARVAGCTHLVLQPPQPGESWDALPAIRAAWDGPIVLGGIQTAADARMAVRLGFPGIVVSNERGRRGSDPVATIDVLPGIVSEVGRQTTVLYGSGVRTGSDVFRALALGADAVLVGRPYVHGLALGGEPGVRHMLRTLLAELDITLAIAGVASRRELRPDALVRT